VSSLAHGQTLSKVPIFSGLTESELEFLSRRAVPRNYAPGEIIFDEGAPCSGMYVVESGNVRIFKSSASGREQVLSIDGPGSSIAELPVFDGGNYPASAAAIDQATLVFVSKQDFQALCLAHPQVALKVLRVVGSRLRRLVGIIEELSFTAVRQRLASFLELRDDRRNVVVLFLNTEAPNTIHNCGQQSLARQVPMLLKRFNEAALAKFLSLLVAGFGDAIGVQRKHVTGKKILLPH
jgi:CRP-like cAMP-binding protein